MATYPEFHVGKAEKFSDHPRSSFQPTLWFISAIDVGKKASIFLYSQELFTLQKYVRLVSLLSILCFQLLLELNKSKLGAVREL